MAFVYELVPEEGMEFLKSFHFATPPGCGGGEWIEKYFHFGYSHWVIDKERDIIFVSLCGQGNSFDRQNPPIYHRLIWQEQPIEIETYRKGSGSNSVGIKAVWEIDHIAVPDVLKVSGRQVIETLKEAIDAFERRNGANVVSIDFPSIETPLFVKGRATNG